MTESSRDNLGRFKPGFSGNSGNPKGITGPKLITYIRERVLQEFDFEALNKLKTDDPPTYWRVVTSLLPRQQEIKADVRAIHVGPDLLEAIDRIGLKAGTNLGELEDEEGNGENTPLLDSC